MPWIVEFFDEFEFEFDALRPSVQDAILSRVIVLQTEGPVLGRPHVDALKGSRYPNMKELRCGTDDGVWRVAFAFDPARRAILLAAGDKSGGNARRFYERLIARADDRFDRHLARWRG